MAKSLGLDIGGANIKVATSEGSAQTIPFALWRNPGGLKYVLEQIARQYDGFSRVGLTMTGELCDCYLSKREGVESILNAADIAFHGRELLVYSLEGQFRSLSQVRENPWSAAASNWLALAHWVGKTGTDEGLAILIDTGSTTTDLIPIRDGVPIPQAKTDYDRMRSGELVYTGATRTPLCAILEDPFAAEFFATSEDAYVLLQMLPENETHCDTADGRPMTRHFAHARLARMLGADHESLSIDEAIQLAQTVFSRQRQKIVKGLAQVLQNQVSIPRRVTFSGSGEFLARAAWKQFIHDQEPFENVATDSLTQRLGPERASAACAYAMVMLLEEDQNANPLVRVHE